MSETLDTLSLGQQLKNAREALNLSIDDVAHKTNLKKSHIESLENDIFILANVPPAFVRGYVRKYVSFLRLPESLIQQANYGEVTIPKEVKKAAPIKVSNNHKSQSRWVKWLTGLILLCAIGMTLAWWWQEHKKDELSRDSLVSSSEVAANQTLPALETTSNTGTEIHLASNHEELALAAPAENTQEGVELEHSSETPTPDQTVQEMSQAVDNRQENANSMPLETAAAILAEPQQETVAEEPVPAVGNDELRIEITGGQSWITVRTPKSKKSLAEKLYNSGDVLAFNNNEQYRLTIGAPANVKIYYKGEQVPLKVDGRVVRIKLPQ